MHRDGDDAARGESRTDAAQAQAGEGGGRHRVVGSALGPARFFFLRHSGERKTQQERNQPHGREVYRISKVAHAPTRAVSALMPTPQPIDPTTFSSSSFDGTLP